MTPATNPESHCGWFVDAEPVEIHVSKTQLVAWAQTRRRSKTIPKTFATLVLNHHHTQTLCMDDLNAGLFTILTFEKTPILQTVFSPLIHAAKAFLKRLETIAGNLPSTVLTYLTFVASASFATTSSSSTQTRVGVSGGERMEALFAKFADIAPGQMCGILDFVTLLPASAWTRIFATLYELKDPRHALVCAARYGGYCAFKAAKAGAVNAMIALGFVLVYPQGRNQRPVVVHKHHQTVTTIFPSLKHFTTYLDGLYYGHLFQNLTVWGSDLRSTKKAKRSSTTHWANLWAHSERCTTLVAPFVFDPSLSTTTPSDSIINLWDGLPASAPPALTTPAESTPTPPSLFHQRLTTKLAHPSTSFDGGWTILRVPASSLDAFSAMVSTKLTTMLGSHHVAIGTKRPHARVPPLVATGGCHSSGRASAQSCVCSLDPTLVRVHTSPLPTRSALAASITTSPPYTWHVAMVPTAVPLSKLASKVLPESILYNTHLTVVDVSHPTGATLNQANALRLAAFDPLTGLAHALLAHPHTYPPSLNHLSALHSRLLLGWPATRRKPPSLACLALRLTECLGSTTPLTSFTPSTLLDFPPLSHARQAFTTLTGYLWDE